MEDINNTANMPEENKQEFFFANGVQNNSFVKDNLRKVGIFIFLLNIFYPIGWHYKQWKEIKKNNEEYKNISPFWRGVFYPFFSFKLTKIIKELFEIKKDIDLRTITDKEELKKVKKEHKKIFDIWPYVIWISIIFLFMFYFSPDSDLDKLLGAIAWILIYLPIHNLQHAINYIMSKETKEKVFSLSDLLGVPFFALLLAFFFFGIGGQSCFEVEGNTLKNTCEKYSLTFPLEGEIQTIRYFLCQGNEENTICVGEMERENPNEPELTLDQLAEEEYNPVLDKFTKQYANHTTHCFKEKDEEGYFYQCYMKIEEIPGLHLGFLASENNFENLEKMMNSYKSW